jgi:hypothetical protein
MGSRDTDRVQVRGKDRERRRYRGTYIQEAEAAYIGQDYSA